MQYGICFLSIVPLRLEPADTSEMVTQVLYGECFKVLETRKKWCRIRLAFDRYEGWMDRKQFRFLKESEYTSNVALPAKITSDLVSHISTESQQLMVLPMGCEVQHTQLLKHQHEGATIEKTMPKAQLVTTALLYLNAPYLWGGKTPFGIDCSGFTQMVYKLNGYALLRDASQQATQGEPLSFIEESEPGDLAFFDNTEGAITHVGIIMKDNYIIHAHGHVRVDRLDHTGIFNYEKRTHTHKLRVIKRII
tara:strand:+ start:5600 stop:6349 length:750 start_codon:yes stop_codon:yes gene_type:complete